VRLVEPNLAKKDTNHFRRETSECMGHILYPLLRMSLYNTYLQGIVSIGMCGRNFFAQGYVGEYLIEETYW
jgi:hypothetical protein